MCFPLVCEKQQHACMLSSSQVQMLLIIAWQKHALQSHPQVGQHFKQVANAAPIGVHESHLELQGLMQQSTKREEKTMPLSVEQGKAQG